MGECHEHIQPGKRTYGTLHIENLYFYFGFVTNTRHKSIEYISYVVYFFNFLIL